VFDLSRNHKLVRIERLPEYLKREEFREKLSEDLLEYYEKVVEFMKEKGRPPSIKEVEPPNSVDVEKIE